MRKKPNPNADSSKVDLKFIEKLEQGFWAIGGAFGFLVVGGVGAALVSWIVGTNIDESWVSGRIAKTVCEKGLKEFDTRTQSKAADKLVEVINSIFDQQIDAARNSIKETIQKIDQEIKLQEKVHKQTREQNEASLAKISEQRQKLENEENELREIEKVIKEVLASEIAGSSSSSISP